MPISSPATLSLDGENAFLSSLSPSRPIAATWPSPIFTIVHLSFGLAVKAPLIERGSHDDAKIDEQQQTNITQDQGPPAPHLRYAAAERWVLVPLQLPGKQWSWQVADQGNEIVSREVQNFLGPH